MALLEVFMANFPLCSLALCIFFPDLGLSRAAGQL